ncbi:hypothetical protein NDU88_000465 [Pleurodeles waltl]|uniref:Uncharacterized protein n=1 Tax=Pleurodeles waltl TaxID=8319 RepID=A0AAV7KM73_PLEWA|nr:hypothetical protein NDU88_000465 [Pleurodeles waltl]
MGMASKLANCRETIPERLSGHRGKARIPLRGHIPHISRFGTKPNTLNSPKRLEAILYGRTSHQSLTADVINLGHVCITFFVCSQLTLTGRALLRRSPACGSVPGVRPRSRVPASKTRLLAGPGLRALYITSDGKRPSHPFPGSGPLLAPPDSASLYF